MTTKITQSFTSKVKRVTLLAAFLLTTVFSNAALTYTLDQSVLDSPKKAEIVAAMDHCIEVYNKWSDYTWDVKVEYDADIPTANANYLGRIAFGKQISAKTAMHEMGHILGIGTFKQGWDANRNSDKKWTGAKANALLKSFDGENAILYADIWHFWPYGLNRDPEDEHHHVHMVGAMREDMGLKNKSRDVSIQNNGIYSLKNVKAGKMVDVNGNQNNNLDRIVSWPANGGSKQKWILVSKGSGYYQLKNSTNNRCIDISGSSKRNNGDKMVQWDCHNGNNQRWKPVRISANRYQFKNLHSGKCLDLTGGNTANLTPFQQWTCSSTSKNQQFDLTQSSLKAAEEVSSSLSENITDSDKLSVYPNPGINGIFNISASVEKYEVLNASGSLVYSGSGNMVDLSAHAKGLYILKANNSVIKLINR